MRQAVSGLALLIAIGGLIQAAQPLQAAPKPLPDLRISSAATAVQWPALNTMMRQQEAGRAVFGFRQEELVGLIPRDSVGSLSGGVKAWFAVNQPAAAATGSSAPNSLGSLSINLSGKLSGAWLVECMTQRQVVPAKWTYAVKYFAGSSEVIMYQRQAVTVGGMATLFAYVKPAAQGLSGVKVEIWPSEIAGGLGSSTAPAPVQCRLVRLKNK